MESKKQENKRKLYLIGNGFDLHHGLKTRYKDFADYLKSNNNSLYYLLESSIHYPDSENDLWSKFEENLANLSIEDILADNEELLPDILSESYKDGDKYIFPDAMQEILDGLTSGLITTFAEFIRNVVFPESFSEKMLDINKDALFLTFNFTYTLEDKYKIDPKNILHIHNGAESRYADIILGHGIDPDNFKEKEETPPDNLTEEELEKWWDYQIDKEFTPEGEGKKILQQYFALTFKNTEQIISENEDFFEKLSNVDKIIVLGHSLSEVDLPYFKKIVDSVGADVKWKVSIYDFEDIESFPEKLMSLGIDEQNIELIEMEELQTTNRQLKIL